MIRWSSHEILQGYKNLPGGVICKFLDALKQKSHVKIDMIALINGKFIEVTNFFFLILEKPNEEPYIINFGAPYTEEFFIKRMESLTVEIEKLFYSAYYFAPFKGTKRLWALSRHNKDAYMISLLEPFISGRISLLYQLKSEIDTIINVLERVNNIPEMAIYHQVQEIKSRIAYVLEIQDKQEIYYDLLNSYNLDSPRSLNIDVLKKVYDMMVKDINFYTIKYLHHVGLLPIPKKYLPSHLSYDPNEHKFF